MVICINKRISNILNIYFSDSNIYNFNLRLRFSQNLKFVNSIIMYNLIKIFLLAYCNKILFR